MLEIHLIQCFGIAGLVPSDGATSYEELAAATDLDMLDIKRLLKRALLNYLFQEKDGKRPIHRHPEF